MEEDPYLLEVVCSIHLNPLRAGRVADLAALDAYPWTGHSALVGQVSRSWQAGDEGLAGWCGAPTGTRAVDGG